MARGVVFAPGEFYHIYNRGTDKRKIFDCRADYERFLLLLYLCNQTKHVDIKLQGRTVEELWGQREGEPLIDIAAYCLMPNHFHLIVREHTEGGVSKFIQKLITGYTMYFNTRHERSGALFQGKFKAVHVSDDRQLSYLISYVHLNPIKLIEPLWKEIGIEDQPRTEAYLEKYRYSSYQDYCGKIRLENKIINKTALPEYFTSPADFKKHVTEWLNYKP